MEITLFNIITLLIIVIITYMLIILAVNIFWVKSKKTQDYDKYTKIENINPKEIILNKKDDISKNGDTKSNKMVNALIMANTGIDINESKNFIKFKSSDVYEIKVIKTMDNNNLVYTIERSSDGIRFDLHDSILRECMEGCRIPKIIIDSYHE